MLNKQYTSQWTILFAAFLLHSNISAAEPKVELHEDATAQEQSQEALIQSGKDLFKSLCQYCHTTTYDDSRIGAPGMQGVLERHNEDWLDQWLKNPEEFAKTDDAARNLINSNEFGLAMPIFPIMKDDKKRAAMIEYLKTLK